MSYGDIVYDRAINVPDEVREQLDKERERIMSEHRKPKTTDMPKATIHVGDCLDVLEDMPSESVHCCVTSPPYWGLRDYGHDDQLGLEESMQEYVDNMVQVFAAVKRVLRDDGTLWLNLGDSYATVTTADRQQSTNPGVGANRPEAQNGVSRIGTPMGLKTKDQCLIPHRVAMALQADGWYLRSTIVWAKGNPMPESVTDRPTSSHEYVFLLSKSKRYFYDSDAIRENTVREKSGNKKRKIYEDGENDRINDHRGESIPWEADGLGRNKRDVWQINTRPFGKAHFAVYPPDLVEPCIKAGTSNEGVCSECGSPWERTTERTDVVYDDGGNRSRSDAPGAEVSKSSVFRTGKIRGRKTTGWEPTCDCDADTVPATVLDPFAGAGTTGLVAIKLVRNARLIELVPAYAEMAAGRLREECGRMFNQVQFINE